MCTKDVKRGMEMIKAVLFDFDGTLMDTKQTIKETWKYIFKKIKNIDVDDEMLKDSYGEPLRDSLEKFFPDVPVEESIKVFKEYQKDKDEEMFQLFADMYETVKELKKRDLKLGLVTSRGAISTERGLRLTGIRDDFDILITAEKTVKHKPSPMPILLALEELGVTKAQGIMVGDTKFDLMASKKAKVKSVLVSWSEINTPNLGNEEYAPDYIIEKGMEIVKIIEEI